MISIHALRMERDLAPSTTAENMSISIHALRMERDDIRRGTVPRRAISIHALRMERDGLVGQIPAMTQDFNPRAPHGARHNTFAI